MEGYQKIIDRLKSDNAAECSALIQDAKTRAAEAVKAAKIAAKEDAERASEAAKVNGAAVVARRLTVAELDVKKAVLAAKKEVVDGVFDSALAEIRSMPVDEYKKLIAAMLKACAEDGDEVVVCEKDKKVVTAAFIKTVAADINKRISLSPTTGKFAGGIVLVGKKVDKNLTLEVELATVKEEMETEVSKRIFAE